MVMLAVLIVSILSCARIPVRLELPKAPTYSTSIGDGVTAFKDNQGIVQYFIVETNAMTKLAKNKVMCREYAKTLSDIIQTTH